MDIGFGVQVPGTGARADVRVRASTGTTLAEVRGLLLAAVRPEPATGVLSVGGATLAGSAVLGEPPLVEGALLEVDAAPRPRPLAALPQLRVVGGPAAGRVHLLAPGEVVVGRRGAVRVDDPDVSREHCRLTPADDGMTVEDLGSTNGTWVEGVRADGPVVLPYDGLLRLGDTTLQLTRSAESPAPVTALRDGRLGFNRPPRIRPPHPVVQVVVPAPPTAPERGSLPVLAVLAPLVLGVAMWRLMGNASFLLFTLLSPVLVVGGYVTERRSGRRHGRREQARWQAERAVAERTLADAVRADELRRRAATPDPATLLLTALGPRPRLWERRRSDDDLLDLRLGLADLPAQVEAEGDTTAAMTTARSVPVVVPLRTAGVLGPAGPRDRARALARSLLVQAAVLHSPRDLQVVVVSDPGSASHWEWVAPLPHCRPEGQQACAATLGLGTRQAAARIGELADLVAARQAERTGLPTGRSDDRPVLLLVDGARALRGVTGLAAVLREGPAVGVVTVALEDDPRLLPEECTATARRDCRCRSAGPRSPTSP